MTKKATVKLESISPYGQSKYIDKNRFPELPREGKDDYEQRTWRERCHYDESGQLFIPPMAFANNIKEAARFLSLQIPGKGKSTYTKHFESGVMVTDPLPIGIYQKDVEGLTLFVPSDGKPGGGSRVTKTFPRIPQWSGTVTYWILDDTITESVFKQVLEAGGQLIGIGFFRPRNRGYWGRFEATSVQWETF
jgi:hypothetical protein